MGRVKILTFPTKWFEVVWISALFRAAGAVVRDSGRAAWACVAAAFGTGMSRTSITLLSKCQSEYIALLPFLSSRHIVLCFHQSASSECYLL
mmetsp:Transcript_19433/g.29327  ORF Transcript_19433/g.29327 Transcript_19433/m.29327 type:complete len:92 (-) Transcript_19433:61-336(-)